MRCNWAADDCEYGDTTDWRRERRRCWLVQSRGARGARVCQRKYTNTVRWCSQGMAQGMAGEKRPRRKGDNDKASIPKLSSRLTLRLSFSRGTLFLRQS